MTVSTPRGTVSIPDGYGLNKLVRAMNARREAEGEPAVLEKGFPWEAVSFPFEEFSAEPSVPEREG